MTPSYIFLLSLVFKFMVHFQTLDIFSRRFTQSMIHGITVSSSMFKNFPARHMQGPLRPRPVSQLITPRQSSKLRVAVSVESLLRQSGTTANSHTLHQPALVSAMMPNTWRGFLPATLAGAAALACAGLFYHKRIYEPFHADGHKLDLSDYSSHTNPNVQFKSRWLLHCTDQLQYVKEMAQLGPM